MNWPYSDNKCTVSNWSSEVDLLPLTLQERTLFMVSEEPLYVIDERLATYPMTSALKVREKLWLHPDLPQAPGLGAIQGPGDTPLPVSPNGSLAPGILYPSSNDPGVRYYLPQYQLHLENGRYTTRLKFRGPSDDPNGPLGWLTIELDAVVPAANGFVLREIDHSA